MLGGGSAPLPPRPAPCQRAARWVSALVALDQAAPLAGWELPEEFGMLRRLLESRMGRRGKREFVQVLRLVENFRKEEVYEAVRDALRLGAISFYAIKHLVLCRIEGRDRETQPGAVPLPAQGHRDEDVGQRLHGAHVGDRAVSERSTVLLEHHLKELKLPTFLREYGKVSGQCAAEGVDHQGYLLRLSELELIDRHHRMVERRIKAARFPATKSLDTFDFLAMPSVNKHLAMQLARCAFTDEQVRWLEAIRDHIAGSVSMTPSNFQYAPFNQQGGLGKACELFGEELEGLLEELNLELVA